MAKKQKNYRFSEETISKLEAVRESFKGKFHVDMSETQVLEMIISMIHIQQIKPKK